MNLFILDTCPICHIYIGDGPYKRCQGPPPNNAVCPISFRQSGIVICLNTVEYALDIYEKAENYLKMQVYDSVYSKVESLILINPFRPPDFFSTASLNNKIKLLLTFQ